MPCRVEWGCNPASCLTHPEGDGGADEVYSPSAPLPVYPSLLHSGAVRVVEVHLEPEADIFYFRFWFYLGFDIVFGVRNLPQTNKQTKKREGNKTKIAK